jgi:effector-binding domain-containing protein
MAKIRATIGLNNRRVKKIVKSVSRVLSSEASDTIKSMSVTIPMATVANIEVKKSLSMRVGISS